MACRGLVELTCSPPPTPPLLRSRAHVSHPLVDTTSLSRSGPQKASSAGLFPPLARHVPTRRPHRGEQAITHGQVHGTALPHRPTPVHPSPPYRKHGRSTDTQPFLFNPARAQNQGFLFPGNDRGTGIRRALRCNPHHARGTVVSTCIALGILMSSCWRGETR